MNPKFFGTIPINVGSINLFEPDLNKLAEAITIYDISHGLSKKHRFGGVLNDSITVAEHSVLCAAIVRQNGGDATMQLRALLHDACEAYTQDIHRSIRQFVFVRPNAETEWSWDEFDKRINLAVSIKLMDGLDPYDFKEVVEADHIALEIEKQSMMSIRHLDWGLSMDISSYIGRPFAIKGWAPETAQTAFMATYRLLSGQGTE